MVHYNNHLLNSKKFNILLELVEAFRIIQSHWNFHEPESDIEYSIQRRTDDMDIHYNYISLSDSDKRVAGVSVFDVLMQSQLIIFN